MERLNGNSKTAFAPFRNGMVRSFSRSAFRAFNRQLFGKKGLHIGLCSSLLCRLRSLACLFSLFAYVHTRVPGQNGNGENHVNGTVNLVLVIKTERIWKRFLTSTVNTGGLIHISILKMLSVITYNGVSCVLVFV